jgi:hypothetical protein
MTTCTLNHNRPNIMPIMLILFILALITVALPAVTERAHASLHTEADQIRQCYRNGSINQIWVNSSGERMNCIVDLPDGRVGDLVTQFCKRAGWVEVTAYILGDGSLAEAVRVMTAKNCTKIYP